MSEKALEFYYIRVNKKEFHISKQQINLDLINVDQIVISDKFEHSDGGLRILLVTKKVKLLNRCVLFSLK